MNEQLNHQGELPEKKFEIVGQPYSIGGLEVAVFCVRQSMSTGVEGLEIQVRGDNLPMRTYVIGNVSNDKFEIFKDFLVRKEAALKDKKGLSPESLIALVDEFKMTKRLVGYPARVVLAGFTKEAYSL